MNTPYNPFVPGMGIYLRDFFAAQAPPAPHWFTPRMDPRPELAREHAGQENSQGFRDWQTAANDWQDRRDQERVLQWPYHYADQLLQRRLEQPQPDATVGGFKRGDVVELVENHNNTLPAAVIGFDVSDPSRPQIEVKHGRDQRPYKTDPELWQHVEA